MLLLKSILLISTFRGCNQIYMLGVFYTLNLLENTRKNEDVLLLGQSEVEWTQMTKCLPISRTSKNQNYNIESKIILIKIFFFCSLYMSNKINKAIHIAMLKKINTVNWSYFGHGVYLGQTWHFLYIIPFKKPIKYLTIF